MKKKITNEFVFYLSGCLFVLSGILHFVDKNIIMGLAMVGLGVVFGSLGYVKKKHNL